MCETRPAIEDEKAVQRFVRELNRFEMLFNETGPKFIDRKKSHVAKIGSQNEREAQLTRQSLEWQGSNLITTPLIVLSPGDYA